MTNSGNDGRENEEKSARDMDDESLFDRLFPDELVEWVKDKFGKDDEDEDGPQPGLPDDPGPSP